MSLDQATLADVVARADRFRDNGQWLQAATLYGEVLENIPPSLSVWVQYAHMLKEGELFEEAAQAYQSAVFCDGTEPDPRLHLAHLLKRLGRSAQALEVFRALQALPDAPHVEQEIAGLRIALMQAEPKAPEVFARDEACAATAACLAGFSRLQSLEKKRLLDLADRNRHHGEQDTRQDLPLVLALVELCRMKKERPLHARLDPKAHLVMRAGTYVATTRNPQFSVLLDGGPLQPGWFEIEIDLSGPSMFFNPILYVEHSAEWASFSTFTLRPLGGGKFRATGFIDNTILRLRLDPAGCEGAFTVGSFAFRQICLARSLRRAYREDRPATKKALSGIKSHKSAKHLAREIADILRYPGPERYQVWIAAHDTPTKEEAALHQRAAARWLNPPLISVVIKTADVASEHIAATLQALKDQSYGHWQLRLMVVPPPSGEAPQQSPEADAETDPRIVVHPLDDPATMTSVLRSCEGRFIVFLRPGDVLAPSALYRIAERSIANPDARLIYGDEDSIDAGLRHSPLFKPDWDPDYFFASNYLGAFVAFETGLMAACCAPSLTLPDMDIHDLILRATELLMPNQITHIPRLLFHRPSPRVESNQSILPYPMTERRRDALSASLARQNRQARIAEEVGGLCRVIWPLPDPAPLVTLIIPTRDSSQLLRECIDSIQRNTAYPAFEIIVVDNGSAEPETHAYFAALRANENIRVIDAPGPFNFSRLNNLAVGHARGSVVGLINNDILAIDSGWLQEMVSHAVRPEIGAVGAKLLYRTGHVQHAGVVCGIGLVAAHPHKYRSGDDPGYMGRLAATQSLSAVTAACLVVETAKYRLVEGLDAENLPVAFNDVDFCLKLDAAGYRNIYTPHATLVHLESVTRGLDTSPEKTRRYKAEANFMLRKWGARIKKDPFYNVNLTTDREDFSIND